VSRPRIQRFETEQDRLAEQMAWVEGIEPDERWHDIDAAWDEAERFNPCWACGRPHTPDIDCPPLDEELAA
jgi:hypothetical protein